MTTPTTVDTFSRYMAEMFDEKELISVPTGFQAFFGSPMTGARTIFSPDALDVDIDIVRGNERTSALVPRETISRMLGPNQRSLNVEQFTTFSRKYPLSVEKGDITADQINYRVAGENPYENMTRMSRLRILAAKIHMESMRRQIRLFERLATQSILTGEQDAILGTTNDDQKYDFRRRADHTITVGVGWNQSNATIMANVDTACDRIRANGKVMPDMMVLGGNAMDAFINNTDVKDQADNRRFELIQVSTNNPVPEKFMRFVNSGFIPRGRLRTPKGYEVWLFTYVDVYTDENDNAVKYMPEDQAIVCSSMARCDRYFGPPEMLPMIPSREQWYREMFGFSSMVPPMPPMVMGGDMLIDPRMFYCSAYTDNMHTKISICTQSAPIFATTATDMFVNLRGLVT